ncbi:hypothetical protein ALP65_00869 [Pseudomonas aeruginosa]|uniref:Cysteine synthase B n=20 Tax=Gammaproteobacteria TaxID=1236 RepID=A0A3M5DNU0_PSEAI|nr:hypothetical protein ALP65_00869 [Pseudomonas aeruginosa]
MRIAALDQGTTSTRVLVASQDGSADIQLALRHQQHHPQSGWVEHDPLELLANLQRCLEASGRVDAIGLANQGESCMAWDARSGEPLSPLIVWQDNRTTPHIERLRASGAEALVLERSGLPLDAYFSASKLGWIVEHLPAARRALKAGRLRLGTSDAWFLDRLCGTFATDVTTASRTALMNLAEGRWDPDLCALFGVPIECLPEIRDTVGHFGVIGNTPLVRVTRFDTGPCTLYLKLESQNPGGSIKDRIGVAMIEAAERDGRLRPGGTIVEATAGNTGLGLALVGRAKGYRVVLVVPDKMSTEKVLHLRAMGAEVHITRSDVGKGHPEYYQDVAARLAQDIPGAFFADQFNNPANPLAHECGTGPELWAQTGHDLDAIVVGVGSSGTLTGLTRFFQKVQPELEMVLADPEGSIMAEYSRSGTLGTPGSWAVEGIGEDFVPAIADLSSVRHAYSISDEESFAMARELLRVEGIPGGSSTGTLLAAALRFCREQKEPKRVVSFVCDTGTRYLSKIYNDQWMTDQGLLQRKHYGDLRDIIARRFEEGRVISVGPDDTLLTAFQRMRLADVSQLPVLDDGKLVGVIDESDILLGVHADAPRFRDAVSSAMNAAPETLAPGASLAQLQAVLDRGLWRSLPMPAASTA